MNSFSVASVTASCAHISQRVLSSLVELEELAQHLDGDARLQNLDPFPTKLQQFQLHVEQLHQSLSKATVVSESLQALLTGSLRSCEEVAAAADKQVKRLDPETISAVNVGAVSTYVDFFESHGQLFEFMTQTLSL